MAGVFQLVLVWVLFVIRCPAAERPSSSAYEHMKTPVKREGWKLSIVLSWVAFFHIAFIIFVTFLPLSTKRPPDATQRSRHLQLWATFLGVSAGLLSALQYAPQIAHTACVKLVGVLSIPMMLLQAAGAVLMVLSIALSVDIIRRRGRDTRHPPRHVHLRARHHKLGLDDFGRPLAGSSADHPHLSLSESGARSEEEASPMEAAVGDAAVESDVRSEHGVDVVPGEETPLLVKSNGNGDGAGMVRDKERGGVLAWFRR
ncbi:hypothetical protein BV20DRAFT_983222 [Pilatotrama ljubarskyi]|nr:hypothetical protein BV20DRAFT_983222 [Pilatotrama ljubarskyi]